MRSPGCDLKEFQASGVPVRILASAPKHLLLSNSRQNSSTEATCAKRLTLSDFVDCTPWHLEKTPMSTGLANVRRHEMPDSCRLNFSLPASSERDNPLMDKKMSRCESREAFDAMRHIPVAFAPQH
jgi:hypothetical protein